MADEQIPGVVGEIDTPEEIDAVEKYVAKKATRYAIILIAVAFLALAAGAWFDLHPDKWSDMPWASGSFKEPGIIERSIR